MERAAVLIGVKRTGSLPELQAVTSRVHLLAEWAKAQGIPEARLKVLTDESGEVRVHHVADAIEELVGLSTVEQLIVYFAGHGVNNRGDYWLLSRAPGNPNEAVNVEGSLLLARYCGIPHVVCISDACRTAADGIQAQHVTGSEIFPSEAGADEQPVDAFFACARGKPSLEIKDPKLAAGEYSALYTDELIACLKGERANVLESEREDGAEVSVARAWKLADHLRDAVPALLRDKLGSTPRLNQMPVARITSRNAWLARIPGRRRLRRLRGGAPEAARSPLITPFTVSANLLTAALQGDVSRWQDLLDASAISAETSLLKDSVQTYSTAFGPTHFETNCGFKLRGARVKAVLGPAGKPEVLDAQGTIVRAAPDQAAANVLLELRDGTGVLVPALREFIAELTFEDGELANIAYEPSDRSSRWGEFDARRDELRALRASISAAVGLGVFRPSGDDVLTLARKMQFAKGIDPTMALYAAYAYHDLQRRDLIEQMHRYMRGDLGVAWFDLGMLSGKQAALDTAKQAFVPPFPLLAQGWTLLPALRIRLRPVFADLQQHLLPALWTMFDATGVDKLRAAITSGELQS